MKLSHTLAALAFAAAVATALSAVAANAPTKSAAVTPSHGPDPGLAQKGKALYATHCIHCHGINMVTPGTVAFDLRQFPHDDKARFVNSVTHGKNGRMPPWGDVLTPQEIDELWAYVLTGGKS